LSKKTPFKKISTTHRSKTDSSDVKLYLITFKINIPGYIKHDSGNLGPLIAVERNLTPFGSIHT